MPQLTATQWRVIARVLRFARDVCEEAGAQPILDIIGEQGEKAVPAPAPKEPTRETD